jgi:ribosomal protein S12 methylthiotransferase accessory factor
MRIETVYPGGVRVDAVVRGFTVASDQPVGYGGDDTAPAPFELFLASIATCAGFYAVQFCRKRQLPTAGLALSLDARRDPETHQLAEVHLELSLPDDFPEKYREAIVRAIDQCAVKRALEAPPRFTTTVVEHESAFAAV